MLFCVLWLAAMAKAKQLKKTGSCRQARNLSLFVTPCNFVFPCQLKRPK
jgi:hypothetical protein